MNTKNSVYGNCYNPKSSMDTMAILHMTIHKKSEMPYGQDAKIW